ncbi:hypothetical protein OIU85_002438, partial [Salix viminalis]
MEDFHAYSILWTSAWIVYYVDDVPVRVVRKVDAMGGDFPSKAMTLLATIWDGSDWATGGGRNKTTIMAMKNSLCRCRVLAKIATSQPTTRRIPPSITLLLQQSSYFPRPKEIPFQAKVANSINLIGYIDMPIQTLVSSHDGKFTAATVITQEPSYHSPALRIPIIFEGDLAHIAASHLKKGDFVKIGGQLSTDPPPFPEMQDQTQVLVLGNSINFVEGSFQMKKSLLEQQLEGPLDDDVSMKRNGESGSNSWIDLLENPDQWWDYRSSKLSGLVKPKHPDFKHKNKRPA